jgi:hypothetical protein
VTRLSVLASLALLGGVFLGSTACDSGTPAPAPVQEEPLAAPEAPGVPALTTAQIDAVKKTFEEARVWIEEARRHREAGEAAMRSGDGVDMQAAIPHFQEAIPLYRKASQHVEEWIEPDFGKVTEEQRDAFLRPELHELSKWQKEMASMGKVPPKE